MKKYKISILTMVFATLLAGCSEDFLSRYPSGGTITQSQYEKLSNTLEGSMRGVYSLLYANNSTDHDAFGQRAIDMYGDLLCGDMALVASNYGWFRIDEQMMGYTARNGFLWSYYYRIIHNTNIVINLVNAQSNVISKVNEFGLPTKDNKTVFTANDTLTANYYAQALTMRSYAYAGLMQFFCRPLDQIDVNTTYVLPIYTESNMGSARPRSTAAEVYNRIQSDLGTAIEYFDAFKQTRSSKLEANADVARGLLAYAYLNMGKNSEAFTTAKDVIDSGNYRILPNASLYSTGFNNVNENSWMWGEDVTVENVTGLASFFGQVDIHSYSYAWAGDFKVIDENLYKAIPTWDGRKKWFRDDKSKFQLCPDGKFYSAANPTSTNVDDIDREWLSDNVFMRIEAMYLIAAEAAYQNNDLTTATDYLKPLLDQRLDTAATAAGEYATYLATLTTADAVKEAIILNWRVEMWGEGYGLQTFRRLTHTITRGGNHLESAGKEVNYTDNNNSMFTFEIPSSETTYNPYIGTEL